jgi:PAS domain S-box-containing protein
LGAGRELVATAAKVTKMRVETCPPAEVPDYAVSWAPDAIIIGEDTPDPLNVAQAGLAAIPQAQLVFLVPGERLERFRNTLPFVPRMASAFAVDAHVGAAALAAALERAREAARGRALRANLNAALDERRARPARQQEADERLRQLQISQDYLAALLTQAPDGLVALSPTGEVLAWNAAAAALFDRPAAQALGLGLTEAFPASVAEVIQGRLARAANGEIVAHIEASFTSVSGDIRRLECRLAPVRGPDGELTSISVSLHDVTARWVTEAKLRESELRYRTLTESLPQLVWTCRADGWCDFLGTQWVTYTGIPAEEQLGFAWLDRVIHPDDHERTHAHWMGALAGAHPYDIEYRIRRHDGVYRWFKTRGTPLKDSYGRVTHWFGTSTDIEDVVQAREVLARSAEELEAQITAEIAKRNKAEEALRQVQKMEAIGQLTGGIAHDFNNLLQGIIGSLDLIAKRINQNRLKDLGRLLDAAQGSANRAASLTHRLLTFSRRQALAPKPTAPAALARGMEDLLRRTLGEQIRLEFQLAEAAWITLCDPVQLESAILNLALNARDAMPDGGVLTIATRHLDLGPGDPLLGPDIAPGAYVCVEVTDTGVGMPPDVISRAFDPFFTTKPIGQGTGLGLSMVYGFARQSDGQVTLESETGRGTSVKLLLPRYLGPAAAALLESGPQAEPSRRGEVVLVVEDEPVVRNLLIDVLTELQYQVLSAEDGPAGLRILQSQQRIDLLVSDIGLPGLNGRQLADAARRQRPHLKVLFMTGYAERAVLGKGMLDHGMTLITKPFTIEALSAKVREILEVEPGPQS